MKKVQKHDWISEGAEYFEARNGLDNFPKGMEFCIPIHYTNTQQKRLQKPFSPIKE